MATVNFPAGFYIDRDSGFDYSGLTEVDIMDDNTPRIRQLASSDWVTIDCRFPLLTLSEKNTLMQFIQDNAANTILWTIDGIAYSGHFKKGHRQSMTGARYNITVQFYAREV